MIKAIIFDCFGVLATEAWLPFKAQYFGHDEVLFEEATDLAKRANYGLISQGDFIKEAARMAGITPLEAERYISRNVPNEELFAYIGELKKSYKIGFLSNIAGNYLSRIFEPEQLVVFNKICLSYETGYIKPEPEAFLNIATKLGVEPGEAVMVDDQERIIAGARGAGLKGIVFSDTDSLKSEIAKLSKNSKI